MHESRDNISMIEDWKNKKGIWFPNWIIKDTKELVWGSLKCQKFINAVLSFINK